MIHKRMLILFGYLDFHKALKRSLFIGKEDSNYGVRDFTEKEQNDFKDQERESSSEETPRKDRHPNKF